MEFNIVEHGVVLEEGSGGWKIEINKVSWYGKDARWEIRSWNSDYTKCGKGVAMSEETMKALHKFLENRYVKA